MNKKEFKKIVRENLEKNFEILEDLNNFNLDYKAELVVDEIGADYFEEIITDDDRDNLVKTVYEELKKHL